MLVEINLRGLGRRARRVRLALRSVFGLSGFLTLLVSEEICGRFGSFRRIECLYIALVGLLSDDLVSASLFVRLSVSDETRSTYRQKTSSGLAS